MQKCSLKFVCVRMGSLNAREMFQRRAGRRRWNSQPPLNPLQSGQIKLNPTKSNQCHHHLKPPARSDRGGVAAARNQRTNFLRRTNPPAPIRGPRFFRRAGRPALRQARGPPSRGGSAEMRPVQLYLKNSVCERFKEVGYVNIMTPAIVNRPIMVPGQWRSKIQIRQPEQNPCR